jgi:hypothetical protein
VTGQQVWRYYQMTSSQSFPQLKVHKSHARFIRKNLNLKLNEAIDVVANIHECESWQQLKAKYEKQIDVSINYIPISDVDTSEIAVFWRLIDKYEKELKDVHNPEIHLSSNILTWVLTMKKDSEKFDAIYPMSLFKRNLNSVLRKFDSKNWTRVLITRNRKLIAEVTHPTSNN